ncbi:MAG: hypothetical protein IPM29_25570 [Planctomycetes bacterium]|nr:hypothetical protein [Planctomycetota bacterium]
MHTLHFLAAAAAMLIPVLHAQDRDPAPRELVRDLALPLHPEEDPATGQVALWGLRQRYKLAVDDAAQLWVARSDRSAADRFGWRTTSIRSGERELTVDTAAQPRITGPYRAELRRGGVTEIYELRDDGLEQSFLLTAPTEMDVTIIGALDTDLVAHARPPEHAPVDFLDADGEVVIRYGAAVAIDSAQRRLPLRTSVAAGHLSIHVPGAWLRQAAWPVLVDPLIGTATTIALTMAPITKVAIERDDVSTSSNVAVFFQAGFTAGDPDVFMALCDDDFRNAVIVFGSATAERQTSPDIAFVAGAGRWVAVWEHSASTVTGESVRFHLHDRSHRYQTSNVTQLVAPSFARQRRPVVGGSRWSVTVDTDALIVCESEPAGTTGNTSGTSVWATRIDATDGFQYAAVRLAGPGALLPRDAEAPAVSKDRGIASWIVAWQQHDPTLSPRWTVLAKRVAGDGTVGAGQLAVALPPGNEHLIAPRVDGRHARYVITFGTAPYSAGGTPPGGDECTAIHAQRFTWSDGASGPVIVTPARRLTHASQRVLRQGALSHDTLGQDHWGLTWSTDLGALGGYLSFAVVGDDAEFRDQHLLPPSGAMSAGVTYDDDHDCFQIGYADPADSPARVHGLRWGWPTQAAPSPYGTGCSPAVISTTSSWRAGDRPANVLLTGAPAQVQALLLVSADDTLLPLDPYGLTGCDLLVDLVPTAYLGSIATVTDSNGRAEVMVPLPSRLPDFDAHLQFVHPTRSGSNAFALTRGLLAPIR